MITETEAEYRSDAVSPKETSYLALTGELWVSLVNIYEKIDRVIMAPHCILRSVKQPQSVSWEHLRTTWWRHKMETFSALRYLCEGEPPAICGFPSQRPVTRSVDVFFICAQNIRLSKQPRRRLFEMPSRSLWHHCNEYTAVNSKYSLLLCK